MRLAGEEANALGDVVAIEQPDQTQGEKDKQSDSQTPQTPDVA